MARNIEFDEDLAVKKAMEVFWKKGYNGASMRDLTAAMQINSSSLYNSIGDKQQLFVKCIRNYVEGRIAEAEANAARSKSPLKAIVNFINDAVNTILYSSHSCLAIKTTFEVATSNPDVQAILRKDSDFTHQFILNLVKKAIEQNEIDSNKDPEALTDLIISAFAGWHESYIIYQDTSKIKRMAKFLVTQISD